MYVVKIFCWTVLQDPRFPLNSVSPGYHSTKPLYILHELTRRYRNSVDFGGLPDPSKKYVRLVLLLYLPFTYVVCTNIFVSVSTTCMNKSTVHQYVFDILGAHIPKSQVFWQIFLGGHTNILQTHAFFVNPLRAVMNFRNASTRHFDFNFFRPKDLFLVQTRERVNLFCTVVSLTVTRDTESKTLNGTVTKSIDNVSWF